MTPLRRMMIEEMRIRNLAPSTQEIYVGCVARYAKHFGQSPDQLGPEHVHEYFRYLTVEADVGNDHRITVACALRFLYHKTLHVEWSVELIPLAKREKKLPVVLNPEEVSRFFAGIVSLKHRAMLMTIYGSGLRASEETHMHVRDIDRDRKVIHVRHGKGAKDRDTILAQRVLPLLDAYSDAARPTDWLFPGRKAGSPISRPAVYQACLAAARRAQLDKHVTPRPTVWRCVPRALRSMHPMAAATFAARHRPLPHGRDGRSRRRMHRVRPAEVCLHLLPQSPLPQMLGLGALAMDAEGIETAPAHLEDQRGHVSERCSIKAISERA